MTQTKKAWTQNLISKALTTLFILPVAIPGAAEAKIGTCHMGWPGETLERFTCDVDRRTNANGHVVFDVTVPGERDVITIVLWDDNTAEFIADGQVVNAVTEDLRGGNVRLISDRRGEFNFIFPTR